MLYEFQRSDYDEEALFDWRSLRGGYGIRITKNGRKYFATLSPLQHSYKLTLTRMEDSKKIIELRFRNTSLKDALVRAEYYIMEYAE